MKALDLETAVGVAIVALYFADHEFAQGKYTPGTEQIRQHFVRI
jgi:hypothetical protein